MEFGNRSGERLQPTDEPRSTATAAIALTGSLPLVAAEEEECRLHCLFFDFLPLPPREPEDLEVE